MQERKQEVILYLPFTKWWNQNAPVQPTLLHLITLDKIEPPICIILFFVSKGNPFDCYFPQ